MSVHIIYLFLNSFNKFNNTGKRILDSIYHMPFKILKIAFWRENVKISPFYAAL